MLSMHDAGTNNIIPFAEIPKLADIFPHITMQAPISFVNRA